MSNLLTAYSVKRKSKKKMAEGGPVSAKSEKRPMPDQESNDRKQADKVSDKATRKGDSAVNGEDTSHQAKKGMKMTPMKHPKHVPISSASLRLRDEEDDLEMSAKPASPMEQPMMVDNEEDADRQGPKSHDLDLKMMAEGGDIHDMDLDEAELEHAASLAAAIMMKRKKMAEGGRVDLSMNADEEPNHEDDLSMEALKKENYSESEGLEHMDSPEDSNEHGDSREMDSENDHDDNVVSAIRRKMKARSAITR